MTQVNGLKSIFREDLATICPRVLRSLEEVGITSEVFLLDWVFTGYSRSYPVETARVYWDVWLCLGDGCLLSIGLAILQTLDQSMAGADLGEGDGMREIRDRMGAMPTRLIVQTALKTDSGVKEWQYRIAERAKIEKVRIAKEEGEWDKKSKGGSSSLGKWTKGNLENRGTIS